MEERKIGVACVENNKYYQLQARLPECYCKVMNQAINIYLILLQRWFLSRISIQDPLIFNLKLRNPRTKT